jgi:hypothetical protein
MGTVVVKLSGSLAEMLTAVGMLNEKEKAVLGALKAVVGVEES